MNSGGILVHRCCLACGEYARDVGTPQERATGSYPTEQGPKQTLRVTTYNMSQMGIEDMTVLFVGRGGPEGENDSTFPRRYRRTIHPASGHSPRPLGAA